MNLTQAYFDEATSRTAAPGTPATVQTLLTAYRAIKGLQAQAIADALLETASASPSANALLAQSIVLIWYLGAWFAPLVAGAPPPTAFPPGAVQVDLVDGLHARVRLERDAVASDGLQRVRVRVLEHAAGTALAVRRE